MTDERALVKKILKGDREAQTLFYRENARRLYHVCVHFLGPGDDEADDIVQQVFLIALGKLREFEFRSSLYTWLSGICANLCFESLRRRKRTLSVLQEDLERLAGPQGPPDQEAEREHRERVELLARVRGSLSERCRLVMDARDRGESYMDISRVLGIPMGTVMSQLARCRKALRNLFEAQWKGGDA